MNLYDINIITGLSGSGKSTAIAAFEDAGYYCVDNLPVALLPKFLELPVETSAEIAGLAFVMDLREKDFLQKYSKIFNSLKEQGYILRILFLEASEEVLLRRYSQTRRHHPLSRHKNLIDGIRAENDQLKCLRQITDTIIDTTTYNVHELKSLMLRLVQKSTNVTAMRINIMSFGFKYGVPKDTDLIIDVRFLANPYFVPELKNLDGETKDVFDFVTKNKEAQIFQKKYLDLLDYLIPLYEKEGKAYLTIAFGCTGGRHRSVAIARNIYDHIKKQRKRIDITHRDIDR